MPDELSLRERFEIVAGQARGAYETGDAALAHPLLLKALALGEQLNESGETDVGVREEVLRLYADTALNARAAGYDAVEDDRLCGCGIALGKKWLEQGETAPDVREGILRLYRRKGLNAQKAGYDKAEIKRLFRFGLMLGETWLAEGKSDLGLMRQVILLYNSAIFSLTNYEINSNNILDVLPLYQRGLALLDDYYCLDGGDTDVRHAGFVLLETRASLEYNIGQASRSYCGAVMACVVNYCTILEFNDDWYKRNTRTRFHGAPQPELLLAFESALHTFLTRWLRPHWPELTPATRRQWLALHRSLWTLRHARHNAGYRERLDGFLAQHRDLARNAEEIQALEQAPAGFWPWRPWRLRRRIAALPGPSEQERRAWAIEEARTAAWIAEGYYQARGWPMGVEEPAAFVLALLFLGAAARAGLGPDATRENLWQIGAQVVAAWRERRPWQDPAARAALLTEAGWEQWRDRPEATLSAWIGALPVTWPATWPELANQPHRELLDQIHAFARGEDEPLRRQLDAAWDSAVEAADAAAEATDTSGDGPHATVPGLAHWLGRPVAAEAWLAARLTGTGVAYLAARLCEALPMPSEPTGPAALWQHRKQRFAALTHRHPGPLYDQPLAEATHRFARAVLQDALTAGDLGGLWEALETARLALTSAAAQPPDQDYLEKTAGLMRDVLLAGLEQPPDPSRFWPPLALWLDRLAPYQPRLPSPAEVQARLEPGEALAQLFFGPGDGALEALWLEPAGPARRRPLPAATAHSAWVPVLEAWNALIDPQLKPHEAERLDWSPVLDSAPLRTLADTLGEWGTAAGLRRLVVLFPAELGQLPWDSGPPFDGELALEHAVSLSHWRTASAARDDPAAGARRVMLAVAGKMTEINTREGLLSAAHHGVPLDKNPCSVDLLDGLRRAGAVHVIAHGQFEARDPWRSGLTLNQGESHQALPAWTLPAAGARGRLDLSVCEALRHGADLKDRDLLGVIGIGPAAIAAGARRVTGPLWACDSRASLLFHARLFELLRKGRSRPFQALHAEARRWLRDAGAEELGEFYRKLTGQSLELAGARPFGHPFYWRVFTVLGEGR